MSDSPTNTPLTAAAATEATEAIEATASSSHIQNEDERRERMFSKLANPITLFPYEAHDMNGTLGNTQTTPSTILSSSDCVALTHIPWNLIMESYKDPKIPNSSQSKPPPTNRIPHPYGYYTYLQWRHIQNYQGAESRLEIGTSYARQALDPSLTTTAHDRYVQKAHLCYSQGLECWSRHIGLLTARGALYANEGEEEDAIHCLERAIDYGTQWLQDHSDTSSMEEEEEENQDWYHEFVTRDQIKEQLNVALEYKQSIEEKLSSRKSCNRAFMTNAICTRNSGSSSTGTRSKNKPHHSTTTTTPISRNGVIQWKDSAVTDALMEQQVMNGRNVDSTTNIQQWGNSTKKKNGSRVVYTLLEEPNWDKHHYDDNDKKIDSKRNPRSIESSEEDHESLTSSNRNRRRRRKSSSYKKKRRRQRQRGEEKHRKHKTRRRNRGESDESEASQIQDKSEDQELDVVVDSSSRHGRHRRTKKRRREQTSVKKRRKHRRSYSSESEHSHDSDTASHVKAERY